MRPLCDNLSEGRLGVPWWEVTVVRGRTNLSLVRAAVLLALSMALVQCVHERGGTVEELQVVPYVDLNRYTGTWYEIARYPNSFEEGCVEAKATYSLLADGRIEVLNECRKGGFDRPVTAARGKAKIVDKVSNAKLKVTFFWPFYGDYWVIGLGAQYEYAVIGHPQRKYLWILGRTPKLEESLYLRILADIRRQGYDASKLIRTLQR
jgi:apolipoprotein D and lipocalin family protein